MRMKISRISRERRTVKTMIRLYCRGSHGGSVSLCNSCDKLLGYAMERIDRCPFGEKKPTCAKCTIHCHTKDMREQIRRVMRYAGPRMPIRHPLLAIFHLVDGFKNNWRKSPVKL